MAESVAAGGADAVVANLELKIFCPVADGYVGAAGLGVLQGVGQALLHDSIGGEIHGARERPVPSTWSRTGRPALLTRSTRASRLSRPVGRELGVLAVVHRAEQATHLGQRARPPSRRP